MRGGNLETYETVYPGTVKRLAGGGQTPDAGIAGRADWAFQICSQQI